MSSRKMLRLAIALSVATSACSGGGDSPTVPPPSPPVLASIAVQVTPSSIRTGERANATAAGRDQYGSAIAAGPFAWSSSNTTIATVDASGSVVGLAAGTATITATSGALTGSAGVSVTLPPPELTTLAVTLSALSIRVGQNTVATASGRDQYGATFALGNVSWSSSNQQVAAVTSAGQVTAIAPGTANITAVSGGKIAQATITVTTSATRLEIASEPPTSVANRVSFSVSARLVDDAGVPVPQAGVTVTAASAAGAGGVSQTTNAQGVATFSIFYQGTVGTRTLVLWSAGLAPATRTLTLTAGAPNSISKLRGDAQTTPSGTAVSTPPSVVVRDIDFNPVPGTTVTFSVASGGGSITGAAVLTNGSGEASVGSWTLGAVGANSLSATAGAGQLVTFTATATAAVIPCTSKGTLTVNATANGTINANSCLTLESPLTLAIRGGPHPGNQSTGTYFFDRYTIVIPAGAIVRFDVTDNVSLESIVTMAHTSDNVFRAYGFGSAEILTLNNTAGPAQTLSITVGFQATGTFGSYTIRPVRLN